MLFRSNLYKNRLKMALHKKTELMRLRFEKCMNAGCYKDPYKEINDYYILVDRKIKSLENSVMQKLKDSKIRGAKAITKLDTLSPLKTLTRGYSLVECDGAVVTSSKNLKTGDIVDLHFSDGNAKAEIK